MNDLIKNKILNLFFTFIFIFLHFQNFGQSNRIKIDGVAAVVGDFIILDSDIDKTLIDLQSQGVNVVILIDVVYWVN